MKLVIYPPVEAARLGLIHEAAGSMTVVNAHGADEARREMEGADAFFGKLTPDLLAAATKLRWVQAPTASLEHYIFPELVEHPCQLTNMRGLFSDVIADQVLGYVLCFARNLHTYIRQQSEGRWAPVGGEQARAAFTTGPGVVNDIDRRHLQLSEMTLGVVGVGQIGAEVGRRARAFGMSVLGVDPIVRTCESIPEVWPMERFDELLQASDFVVIAAPQTPETVGLFRAPQFARMKRTAYLINIGRGALVNLADLTEALRSETIAGAALDVFEVEPLPPEHPLWRMPNTILTPHVAGMFPRVAERHTAVLLENIRRFAAREPLTNVADKRPWF